MNDLRKAAQQALEALETASRNGADGLKRYEIKEIDDTIAKIHAALAQPEPPQRKPLTDQEAKVLWADVYEPGHHLWILAERFARAIEKAHGIGGEHE